MGPLTGGGPVTAIARALRDYLTEEIEAVPVVHPHASPSRPALTICATRVGEAGGGAAIAAAVAVALAGRVDGVVLALLRADHSRGAATLLASPRAVELAERLGSSPSGLVAAARGHVCAVSLPPDPSSLDVLADAAGEADPGALVVYVRPELWPPAVEHPGLAPDGALLRGEPRDDRALLALATAHLRRRRIRAKVATRPLGRLQARRAMAGVDPGGAAGQMADRLARGLIGDGRRSGWSSTSEHGQALPLVAAAIWVAITLTALLFALGAAATGKGRLQRAADLAALSAARAMRDDFPHVFEPRLHADRAPHPRHLTKRAYLARAGAAAREAVRRNGFPSGDVAVSFPDIQSIAPLRVRVRVGATAARVSGQRQAGTDVRTSVEAEASATPATAITGAQPVMASGGGYHGPLEHRQGKPMRPDVALAFDRLAASARRAGMQLVISSGYRSDAEQQVLWDRTPDPRWVAPPGRSLHRCGTELDLGPSSTYGWLLANAGRFGFVRRYSWEPWHFGYSKPAAPCSKSGTGLAGRAVADGGRSASVLPSFVPARFRAAMKRAGARHGVSAGLLAAQLMVESSFNPHAVSPAGAQGIAQFMPATARAYGLRDPFDPDAAIDAQASLMSDLLREFGSPALALAAYNAGPGAVRRHGGIPPYRETQAYVARILGMLAGAGEAPAPALEVRLID